MTTLRYAFALFVIGSPALGFGAMCMAWWWYAQQTRPTWLCACLGVSGLGVFLFGSLLLHHAWNHQRGTL